MLVSLGLFLVQRQAGVHWPRFPLSHRQTVALQLPTTPVVSGSSFTLSGGAAGHPNDEVRLEGSWNSGAWILLSTTSTDATGGYTITVPLAYRGELRLRLHLPSGAVGTGTLAVS